MPVLVLFFFKEFYPIVRDAHGHTVVKSDASVFHRYSKAGHAAHFLCDGDGVGVYLMYQLVCKSEIGNGICVFVAIIIIVVTSEGLSETMAVIEH